jgi:hypothetical protein
MPADLDQPCLVGAVFGLAAMADIGGLPDHPAQLPLARVEEESGERLAPILQDADELSRRELQFYALT